MLGPPPKLPNEHTRGKNSTEHPLKVAVWPVYGVPKSAVMAEDVAIVAAAAWSCFFQSSMKAADTASGDAPGAGGMATVVVVGAVVVVGGGRVDEVVGGGFGWPELHAVSTATVIGTAKTDHRRRREWLETLARETMNGILANLGRRGSPTRW